MKERKNIIFVGGLVIALIGVTAFTIERIGSSAQTPQDPKAEIKHQRREARYSTPRFNNHRTEGILLSQLRDGSVNSIDIDYVESDLLQPAVLARAQSEASAERNKSVCDSDIILRGNVLAKTGIITDDDRFIYSVYTFQVIEVLRNNAKLSINLDDQIEFTMPGGTAIVGDAKKRITYNYPLFVQLPPKRQYIVQVKRDAEADDYYVDSRLSVYFIRDGLTAIRMDAEADPYLARESRTLRVPSSLQEVAQDIQSAVCR
ncbi:MAG: hypothetical protein J2P41_17700 [Blastocatellia bacterium]|nr:hypothetical protein [Blastocatellia bacterium]